MMLLREARNDERFCRPDLGIRSGPGKWQIWQNSDDRVRHAVERDAAANHIWVAAHAFLPEIFRHHGYVGRFFFLWQKIAAANWFHPENVEKVRGDLAAKKLNGIP